MSRTAAVDGRRASGPLAGIRVVEIQALGPGPFAGMVLSDFGADVVRVDRIDTVTAGPTPATAADVLARGRRSVGVNLKSPAGVALVLRLIDEADVLIEGFRPGVMERLGLGPEVCLERNPRLVYGRVTGYGQAGPWSPYAGHDIDYIGLAGTLWPVGRAGQAPVPPINYVGDFGGGGMLLALGICAALTERASSNRGQVVDAAMVDGAAMLNAFIYGMHAVGDWSEERGVNLLDTGRPFYDTYETSDGKWVAVGAIEPQFFRNLIDALGLADEDFEQHDPAGWDTMRRRFTEVFRTRTRDDWCDRLGGAEACVAPVLSPWEAPDHPHHVARDSFVTVAGLTQPGPAPRFDRTPATVAGAPVIAGAHTDEILRSVGVTQDELAEFRAAAVIA